MSFDWNLSSDEEKDFDDWEDVELHASLTDQRQPSQQDGDSDDDDWSNDALNRKSEGYATVSFPAENYDRNETDDEGEDIDWEDAGVKEGQETEANLNTKLAADTIAKLKPVTLDMDETGNKKRDANKKTKKARSKYRFEHLAPDLQSFLVQLERAHLMCLTGHALFASRYCSDDEVMNVAHSLIPLAWNETYSSSQTAVPAPTEQDLANFCNFFFSLINRPQGWGRHGNGWARRRRQSAQDGCERDSLTGASNYRTLDYCRHLAQDADDDIPSFGSNDKVHLLISMARSLGWRARYVLAADPIKRDLDVNHPVFVATTTRNVFQIIWRNKRAKDGGGKKPAKRARTGDYKVRKSKATKPLSSTAEASPPASSIPKLVCWVEILCRSAAEKKQGKKTNKKPPPDSKPKMKWIHVDPELGLVDEPDKVESILWANRQEVTSKQLKKKFPISYALAAEHISVSNNLTVRVTDVTPRYSFSWIDSLKQRGILRGKQTKVKESERSDKWLLSLLKTINSDHRKKLNNLRSQGRTVEDAIVLDEDTKAGPTNVAGHIEDLHDHEMDELTASTKDEPMPTSKTAFKSHPIYVIPSVLNTNEVLAPDAKKRVCGVFKGELVFRRADVETALPAKRWLYKGRKVKRSELRKPILRVKARKKPTPAGFRALKSYGVGASNDGSTESQQQQIQAASRPLEEDTMADLFASWQTDPWSPARVEQHDPIPVNEHNNVELELLNPGLVHIEKERIAVVAKKLGIPYAPCLLGFEGHGGNRTPTIRGIVVHEHNAELLREAHMEMASQILEQRHENQQHEVYKRWKRLLVGVLTKERLDRTYGDDE